MELHDPVRRQRQMCIRAGGWAPRVMIAGPRESGDPGVYEAARGWTAMLLRRLR